MAYTSVKISASTNDYQSQMKLAAAQMKTLSSEYSVAATKAKLFGSEADSLKAKAESLTQKITVQKNIVQLNSEQQEKLTEKLSKQKTKQEELKTKVEAAEEAYKKSTEETGKNSEQSKALKEELEKLEQEYKNNETAIGRTETALANQTEKTDKSKVKLMEMEAEIENVNEELKNHKLNEFADACDATGQKVEQFGEKMMVVSAGIAGIATTAIKTASDFDSSMSNVQAISGASAEEMDILRDKAREMGEKTKFSAMEAGDAMSYMAMAGWKTDDMLNSIEGIMTLAAASGEDLALTSDIVTDAMTAFGMSADGTTQVIRDGYVKEVSNATHFADVLAAASSNSNTNVSMLGESFKYVAPVAGALGYSSEDTAIALGLMANAGIKASNSGTALRSMLTNLSKPSDEVKKAMEYLDLSLQNNDGSMKTLMEVMTDLRESFGNCKMPMEEFQNQIAELEQQYESGELTEKEYSSAVEDLTEKAYGAEGALKAKYAATLAGKTGMSGLLAIVGSSEQDFDKLTNAIYESDGAAQEMADIMQDNLEGQVTILKSQLQELSISIGEQLIPFIRDGVTAVQNIVDKFNSMSESQKNTIIKVGLFTAAIGPAAIGIGKFAQGISTTITTGKKLVSGVAGIIAKITAKTAATAAGAAADAAGTAASAAHTAATTAGTAATGGMTVAQTALNAVMNLCPIILIVTLIAGLIAAGIALYKNWDVVKEKLTKFWEKIKEIFNKIKEVITGAFDKAKEAVTNKVNEIKDAFLNTPIGQAASTVFGGAKDIISNLTSAATETAKQNLSNMKTAYEENGRGIKGVVAAGWEGIKGFYSSGFTFIGNLTGGKLSEIKDKFSDKLGKVKDTVKQKWNDIQVSYVEGGEGVAGVLEVLFDQQADAVRGVFDVIQNITGINMEGMKEKVVTLIQKIRNTVVGFVRDIQNKIKSGLQGVKDTISKVFETIKNVIIVALMTIKEIISAAVQVITLPFQFIWENCKEIVIEVWKAIQEKIETAIEAVRGIISQIMEGIKTVIVSSWDFIRQKVDTVLEALKVIIRTVFDFFYSKIEFVMQSIFTMVTTIWNTIKIQVITIINAIMKTATSIWNTIKSNLTTIVNAIKETITTIWNAIRDRISSALNAIWETVTNIFNTIHNTTITVWNTIKTSISIAINTAKTIVSTAVESISNVVGNVFKTLKSTVKNIWNGIKSAIETPINAAKSAVQGAIDAIKNAFNFSWSLPNLKLPHISISGSFSLKPPSAPSFGIEWYKTGAIMNSSMIFGLNGNTLLAGGEPETGGEAILPLAPFYAKLNDILDRKLAAVQQIQNVFVENHTYIDGDEVSSRTVSKVDAQMVQNRRKWR